MGDRETFLEERRVLGDNIRRERARLKLSQEALGFRCKMNVSEVSRAERAAREPRLSTIIRLARGLEVPPAKLLDRVL